VYRGSSSSTRTFFKPAYVEVFGSTAQTALTHTFTPLKSYNYSSFFPQYQLLDRTEHSVSVSDDPYIFIFHIKQERIEGTWGYWFRHGDSGNERHPYLITYYSAPTSNVYRLWYDGREMLGYWGCDEYYSLNNAPWVQFTLGKWHQYAFFGDMYSTTTYIDGHPVNVYPCAGKRTIEDFDQYLYMSVLSWVPSYWINDVRYYGSQRF
jgi:hypothetical protein